MCGIAGFSLSRRDASIDHSLLTSSLLHGIESRGRHATGVAWTTADWSKGRLHKDAVTASVYTKMYPRIVSQEAATAVLHTRYATQGSPDDNRNNHPIYTGDVVGVHNGTLTNDDELFDIMAGEKIRLGQVDSEAAFAWIDVNYGENPTTYLPDIHGRAALAWLDRRDGGDVLHLSRVNTSPLAVGQTARGSMIFASTMLILVRAARNAGVKLEWMYDVPEGTYLRVRGGRILDHEQFPTQEPIYASGMAFSDQQDSDWWEGDQLVWDGDEIVGTLPA